MIRKDFELMAPVGSYESLYAALQGGADSVYFGVEGLNMRARSSANFTLGDLRQIVSVCTEHGVKTYLTVNTVIYNNELEKMREVIDCAKEAGVTAVIASDLAAILYARSVGVEVHISTQCNVSNIEALRFFSQYADVVVLAREVALEQVAEIHRQIVEEAGRCILDIWYARMDFRAEDCVLQAGEVDGVRLVPEPVVVGMDLR